MKIVILTNFIPPYRIALFSELQELADELKVFVSTEMESNRQWDADHGSLDVVVQKSWNYNKKWNHLNDVTEKRPVHVPYDTYRQLRKVNPDVVISGELGIRSLMSAIYCKVKKKPLILWLTLSEHTEKNRGGLRLILRKFLMKSASAFLCNGKSGERYIKKFIDNPKIAFIPCPSHLEPSEIKVLEKTTIRARKKVLYTGRLIELKGMKEMIDALKIYFNQNPTEEIELLIAGDGPERTRFDELSECKNIDLKLLGELNYDQLAALYQEADLYLFPTLVDEWGIVVNEALMYGVPIIGSLYSQAIEELIKEDYNGWLFHPDNQEEFLNVLNKAFKVEDQKLIEMSKNSIISIEGNTPKASAEIFYQQSREVSDTKK